MIRDVVQSLRGLLAPWDGTISPFNAVARNLQDELNSYSEQVFSYDKVVDAMASTATAETPIEKVYRDIDILNVDFFPLAALTGDPTNNAVLNVFQRDLNGVNQLLIATLTTTASMVAFKPVALALSATAANLIVVGGGGLTLSITKGGSGVVTPVGTVMVRGRYR